ncbi:MAG: 4Fe-4S binding protein [Actinomycetia bacterium]|nr:4Fe-4S binding protein [Actinomycetes bacterium]
MSWDIKNLKNWKVGDHPPGALIPTGGNAVEYKTGGWRSEKPRWIEEKCTHCMICWVFCPDTSIEVKESKMLGIDYDHCKGCGICAEECPTDAIEMEEEEK